MTQVASRIDTVSAFFSAFGHHDLGKMLKVCAKGADVNFVPMGKAGQGKIDDLGRGFWATLFDAFANVTVVTQQVFSDGHKAASEVIISGIQRKEFLQIPNLGKNFNLHHAFKFDFELNEISNIVIYWDNVTLFSELGKNHPFYREWSYDVMRDVRKMV